MSTWPTPRGAVEILPAGAQRTDYTAWLNARLNGVGGSDVAAILGLSGFESAFGVWLVKTGRRVVPENDLMVRGRYLEPALCQWFADTSGLSLRQTGTWAKLEPSGPGGALVPGWPRCNPDRFASDGGIIEVKAPNHADWGDLWYRGPALHAVVQLMWCLYVLNLPFGYVVADGPDGLRSWRIDREAQIERWMVTRVGAWYFEFVVDDDMPPADDSDATTLALKQASKPPSELAERAYLAGAAKLARRRHEIKAETARLAKELQGIENELRAALLGAVTLHDPDERCDVISYPWVCLDSTAKKPYRSFSEPK